MSISTQYHILRAAGRGKMQIFVALVLEVIKYLLRRGR